jgi:hypothetical protein
LRYPNRVVGCLFFALLLPATLVAQWTPTGATDPISHNGPVTVGTSTITSGYALDVAGAARVWGNVFLGTNTLGTSSLYLWPDASGPQIRGTGTGIDLYSQGGTIHLFNGNTAIDGYDFNLNSPVNTALTVKGSTTLGANAALKVTDAAGSPLIVALNDGRVGIGTSSPAGRLANTSTNILDSLGAGINPFAITWRATGQGYAIAVRNDDANANLRNGLLVSAAATDASSYVLSVDSGVAPNIVNRLNVRGDGHVGIGTPSPQYALDVVGTIHATQVIGATYQDVAEWVPATMKMSPGTVVVVQRGAKNTVMPSAVAYATTVAGVVSEKPGVILGESSESKAMIATTGRVKVHVDTSNGAIEAGDLLVTSDKSGVAMKSQPVDLGGVKIHRPGTLIGKALESLPSGEGDILVLLSLQ